MSVGVARRTAYGLYERGLGAQKSLLIRIQYGHQLDLRDIQALPQEVDPHQHIEHIQPHVPDDLRALQGIYIGMQVAHAYTGLRQILGQILRHALGESGYEDLAPVLAVCVRGSY